MWRACGVLGQLYRMCLRLDRDIRDDKGELERKMKSWNVRDKAEELLTGEGDGSYTVVYVSTV